MIKHRYKTIQIGLVFLFGGLSALFSQTTNSGILVVMPGTQFSSLYDLR